MVGWHCGQLFMEIEAASVMCSRLAVPWADSPVVPLESHHGANIDLACHWASLCGLTRMKECASGCSAVFESHCQLRAAL